MDSFIKVSEDNIYLNINNQKAQIESVDVSDFLNRIKDRKLSVGIIGLGYSGLQLAVAFASAGFTVTGIEFDKNKAKQVNNGHSYIENILSEDLKKLVDEDSLFAVHDFQVLPELDVIIISDQIPSNFPVNKDASYIMAVVENIISSMQKTQLIIFDTVLLPGMCEEVILPLFTEQNKMLNSDFFLAVSPERIDPGNKNYKFSLTPRVVSGLTKESRILASALFKTAVKQIVEVSSVRVAEMSKLLENAYRWVNVALINEMMIMCNKLGINIWEVIKGVKSNPYEYFHFVPSPGYGSSSHYNEEQFSLSWKKGISEFKYDLLDRAIEINTSVVIAYVQGKIIDLLNSQKKCLNNSNILIVGVSAKKDIREWNESPAVELIRFLIERKANVYYHDPLVKTIKLEKPEISLSSIDLSDEMLKWVDIVIILMDHQKIDFEKIVASAPLILDTRNATEKVKGEKTNVVLL